MEETGRGARGIRQVTSTSPPPVKLRVLGCSSSLCRSLSLSSSSRFRSPEAVSSPARGSAGAADGDRRIQRSTICLDWIGFGPDRRVEAGDYCSFIAFLSRVDPAFRSWIAPGAI